MTFPLAPVAAALLLGGPVDPAALRLLTAAAETHAEAVRAGSADFTAEHGSRRSRGRVDWSGDRVLVSYQELRPSVRLDADGRPVLGPGEWTTTLVSLSEPGRELLWNASVGQLLDRRGGEAQPSPLRRVAPPQAWFHLAGSYAADEGYRWAEVFDPDRPFGTRETVGLSAERDGDAVRTARRFSNGLVIEAVAAADAGWNVTRYESTPPTAGTRVAGSRGTLTWAKRGMRWEVTESTVARLVGGPDGLTAREPLVIKYAGHRDRPRTEVPAVELSAFELPPGTRVSTIWTDEGREESTVTGGAASGGAIDEALLDRLGEQLGADDFAGGAGAEP